MGKHSLTLARQMRYGGGSPIVTIKDLPDLEAAKSLGKSSHRVLMAELYWQWDPGSEHKGCCRGEGEKEISICSSRLGLIKMDH